MIIHKTKTPKHGDIFVSKKFAFLPKDVNISGGGSAKVWMRFYYEKREYLALIPGMIEGWEITNWLKDPSVSNIRRIK